MKHRDRIPVTVVMRTKVVKKRHLPKRVMPFRVLTVQVVILPAEQAEKYRRGFEEKLAEINAASGKKYQVQVGFGVYSASLSGVDSIDGLIELADRLMYSDKAKHKRHPRN